LITDQKQISFLDVSDVINLRLSSNYAAPEVNHGVKLGRTYCSKDGIVDPLSPASLAR
jgi:hypothetical protein